MPSLIYIYIFSSSFIYLFWFDGKDAANCDMCGILLNRDGQSFLSNFSVLYQYVIMLAQSWTTSQRLSYASSASGLAASDEIVLHEE